MREVPFSNSSSTAYATKPSRIITFASLANCIELYDYALYGVFINVIAQEFFPTSNAEFSVILAFASFALSFLFAPFGSIIWGYFGDKFGRLFMIKSSIFFMSVPSLVIALLPGYNKIGISAPIILLLARITQVISISGCQKGSVIYAMEQLGSRFYGRVTGLSSSFGALGIMLAMMTSYLATSIENPNIWRYAFLSGSILIVFSYYIRRKLFENTDDLAFQNKNIKIYELFKLLHNNKKAVLKVFVLSSGIGVFSYTSHVFLRTYYLSMNVSEGFASLLCANTLLCTALSASFIGFLIDIKHVDRLKSFYFNLVMYVFVFMLFLLAKNQYTLLIASSLYGFMLGMNAMLANVLNFDVFNKIVRCRALLFSGAAGISIFGGLTPLILTSLNSLNHQYPFIALTIYTFILYFMTIYSRGHNDSMS